MALINDLIRTNLSQTGLRPFGVTMPVVSVKWLDTVTSTVDELTLNEQELSLTSTANWLAPLACSVRKIDTAPALRPTVTLTKADGAALNEAGLLLTIMPQAYLRLQHLYANLLETASPLSALQIQGLALRPVPFYFFYASSSVSASVKGGEVLPGDTLEINGKLLIFDQQGHVIDPMAVVSALSVLLQLHPILRADAAAPNQLSNIAGLRTTGSLRVRLVQPDGMPASSTNLQNLTSAQPGIGVFTIDAYTGNDVGVRGEILRTPNTGTGGTFPDAQALFFLIGLTSYGRLTNRVRIPVLPAFPAGVSLQHDFFTVKVVQLTPWLIGNSGTTFNGSILEPKPSVRLNEVVQLLTDGNAVMGQISTTLAGSPTDALAVGETIANDFPLPVSTSSVYWPAFPALPAGITPENGAFPSNFKAQVQNASTAQFIDSGTTHNVNVLLTLRGVPLGAAVRAYNRQVAIDLTEERGDGAGGVVVTAEAALPGRTFTGMLQIVLADPLGLRRPDGTFTSPIDPVLNVDLTVVQGGLGQRMIGNLTLPLPIGLIAAPPTVTQNTLLSLPKRGISLSGIHGLSAPAVSLPLFTPNALLNAALQFLGETNPVGRDAPRLPTMARRDWLVASLSTGSWRAVVSGGKITQQLHCASPRSGNPGGLGGPETVYTGLTTQNGRLAYDVARMAYRRTTSIYTRLPDLVNANWNEPAAPLVLPDGSTPTATSGTIAAAVLQNLAPNSDTPELALLKTVLDNNINTFPRTFDALVNWLTGQVNAINPGTLPSALQTAATQLQTKLVTWLNAQKDGNTLNESQKERITNEVIRELSTACYGRRDSMWALEAGIKNARHFIYIETPGFGSTQYGPDTAYSKDLLKLIQQRIEQQPGLHVMICVPKSPDYAPNYAEFLRKEIAERQNIFVADTDNPSPLLPEKRVVVFHPIGFPGRASLIESQVVIVDDVWALIGSSSFRRRGLTFDGSTDVVLTDFNLQEGVSPAIQQFRLALLQQRLNTGNTNRTTLNNPLFSRLQRGRDAFYAIRDHLIDDGYGVVERLWDGKDPHVAYTKPTLSPNLWNPEGQEFSTLLSTFIAFLTTFANPGTTDYHDL